jgi:drug/metabolite transporter (DMT)-like permease
MLAALFQVLAFLLLIYTLKRTDVSIISPLSNLRIIFSTILAILLLGEILPTNKYWWIALTLIAGLFVAIDEKLSLKSFFKREVILFILALFLVSLSSIFVNKGMQDIEFWSFNTWYYIFKFIFILPVLLFITKKVKIRPKKIVSLGIISIIPFVSMLLQNKAMAENVTISTVVFALPGSMILVFIISKIKPKLLESHPLKVYIIRFAAAAVMVVATLKII